MRYLLAGLVSLALLFASGCAPSHSTVDVTSPLFGTGHVGVDIGVDGQPVITGSIGGIVTAPTRSFREVDQCGNVRTVTRAVDMCGNDSRAIASAYRQIDTASICGRGWSPILNATRGLGSRDPRVVVREIHMTQEDLAREYHNAKVARDMIDSSMWSNFRGFWGFKRKICPLDGSLQSPVYVTPTSPQIGEILPEPTNGGNIGLPPSGIIPPPDTKSINNLENRVAALETRANITEGKLDGMKAEILAAIAALKK